MFFFFLFLRWGGAFFYFAWFCSYHLFAYTPTQLCPLRHTETYRWTHIHRHTRIHTHVHIHMLTQYTTHIHTYTCTHTNTRKNKMNEHERPGSLFVIHLYTFRISLFSHSILFFFFISFIIHYSHQIACLLINLRN